MTPSVVKFAAPLPQLSSKTSPVVQLTPWYCTSHGVAGGDDGARAGDHGRDLQLGGRVGIRDRHGRLAVVGPGDLGEAVGKRARLALGLRRHDADEVEHEDDGLAGPDAEVGVALRRRTPRRPARRRRCASRRSSSGGSARAREGRRASSTVACTSVDGSYSVDVESVAGLAVVEGEVHLGERAILHLGAVALDHDGALRRGDRQRCRERHGRAWCRSRR